MKRLRCFFLVLLSMLALPVQADVVLRDDVGSEIRLKAPARRIVALAPHITETLYAAGAGELLVGTVEYSDYPPAAKQLRRVGSYDRFDLEAVAALRPDLIIAWESGNPAGEVAKLRTLGLPVFVTQPNRIDDVAGELERFGRLAGTERVASAAAERFRQRLAELRAAQAGKPKVRVFYQIWKAPLMTIGGPQIISDVIRLCGGENVFGHLAPMAPTVSLEAVLEADPEVIIATGMGDERPEWLSDWNRWPRLTAVKRKNLFHINPDILQRHTPRLLDGAASMCTELDRARGRRPAPAR